MTYTEALGEEGLIADRRKRNDHNHGDQAAQRDHLTGLKNRGDVRLRLIDLVK